MFSSCKWKEEAVVRTFSVSIVQTDGVNPDQNLILSFCLRHRCRDEAKIVQAIL